MTSTENRLYKNENQCNKRKHRKSFKSLIDAVLLYIPEIFGLCFRSIKWLMSRL
ncbi:hypothetical protein HMPREF3225_02335 [Staphylococcus lugdunensis]|uniref:Transposase n=1 Tax=Staphylococcus lugdunensis TaxID=28035 RepID=A0ABD4ECD4_STALU|nr:hypothetical protein HMPREF3225_02335 [Staphylococcus lugdunensis]